MKALKSFLLIFALAIIGITGCINDNGSSSSTGGTTVTPPEAPAAPTLTIADSQIVAQWSAVEGATSYEVYFATSDDSTVAEKTAEDTTELFYLIPELTNDTPYYVWVKAKNASGTSEFSASANATPVAATSGVAPSTPEKPTLTPGDKTIKVNWDPIPGAISYTVYCGTVDSFTDGATEQIATDITGLTYTITEFSDGPLQNGTTYYVWVKATNAEGTSAESSSANDTPVAVPTAPTNVSVTAGGSKLTVTWDTVEGATAYNVYYSTSNNSAGATQSGGDITTSPYTITPLDIGTTYYVWVKAKNGAGTSEFSASASGVPIAAPAEMKVTYDANGADANADVVPEDSNVYTEGSTVTVAPRGEVKVSGKLIPSDSGFLKMGYTFMGWNTKADGTGTLYTEGETFIAEDKDVTLYAMWKQATSNENFEFTYGNGVATLNKYLGDETELVVPEIVNNNDYLYKITLLSDGNSLSTTFPDGVVTVVLPNTLTKIGNYSFYNCTTLTSLTIPKNVTTFESESSFFNTGLTAINVAGDSNTYSSIDGVVYNKDKTTLVYYPAKKADTTFEIPEGVNHIEKYAFSYNCNLEEVIFSDTVTTGGDRIFYKSIKLKKATLSKNLTTVPDYMFNSCSALTDIIIPEGVEEIGVGALQSCALTSLNFPSTLTSLEFIACAANRQITSITIPANVTSIGNSCFNSCNNLSNVYILKPSSEGMITLGTDVFSKFPTGGLHLYFQDQDSIDAYSAATNWSAYAAKMEIGAPPTE